jgi:hypothetical protein
VFSDPKTLFGLADTATKAITTDSDLGSVKELTGFANGLKGLGSRNVHMVTLPVQYDPADPNRVVPLEKSAQQVWTALKQDKPIPASAIEKSAGDKGGAGQVVR